MDKWEAIAISIFFIAAAVCIRGCQMMSIN